MSNFGQPESYDYGIISDIEPSGYELRVLSEAGAIVICASFNLRTKAGNTEFIPIGQVLFSKKLCEGLKPDLVGRGCEAIILADRFLLAESKDPSSWYIEVKHSGRLSAELLGMNGEYSEVP